MIPYIFVTWDEFKAVVTFKFPLKTYLKAFLCYSLFISPLIYYFYYGGILKGIECNTGSYFSLCSLYSYFTMGCFFLLYLFKGLFISVPRELNENDKIDPIFRNKISTLIACYNAEDIIEKTIQHIIVHFPAESIYVADNNKTPQPPNNKTREICEKYGANYYYIPKPSKTNALNTIVHHINKKYEYVIALDDDTLLPDIFCPSEKFFLEDNRVAGVGFSIAINSRKTFVERCVNLEYSLFAWSRYSKNKSSSLFMSGAAGLWKKDLFKVALKHNPAGKCIPYGEDGWNGAIMRANNYKFKHDFQNFLKSYTPDTLYFGINEFKCGKSSIGGFGATNLYKQRALRWYRSGTIKIINNIISLFIMDASNNKDNLFNRFLQNIHYRLNLFWGLLITFWVIESIPTILYYILDFDFSLESILTILIFKVILYLLTLSYLLFNKFLFRNRTDLIFDWGTMLLFPFFISYSVLLRTIGFISSLLYYIPFKVPIKLLFQLHKLNIEEEIENMPTIEELNRNIIINIVEENTLNITNLLVKNPELITKEIVEQLNKIKQDILLELEEEKVELEEEKVELEIISDDEQQERQKTLKELKEELANIIR